MPRKGRATGRGERGGQGKINNVHAEAKRFVCELFLTYKTIEKRVPNGDGVMIVVKVPDWDYFMAQNTTMIHLLLIVVRRNAHTFDESTFTPASALSEEPGVIFLDEIGWDSFKPSFKPGKYKRLVDVACKKLQLLFIELRKLNELLEAATDTVDHGLIRAGYKNGIVLHCYYSHGLLISLDGKDTRIMKKYRAFVLLHKKPGECTLWSEVPDTEVPYIKKTLAYIAPVVVESEETEEAVK